MLDYKTVIEKAAEWDISSHHVQYLCRSGKIEGAVSVLEHGFPDDTLNPVKNIKSRSI